MDKLLTIADVYKPLQAQDVYQMRLAGMQMAELQKKIDKETAYTDALRQFAGTPQVGMAPQAIPQVGTPETGTPAQTVPFVRSLNEPVFVPNTKLTGAPVPMSLTDNTVRPIGSFMGIPSSPDYMPASPDYQPAYVTPASPDYQPAKPFDNQGFINAIRTINPEKYNELINIHLERTNKLADMGAPELAKDYYTKTLSGVLGDIGDIKGKIDFHFNNQTGEVIALNKKTGKFETVREGTEKEKTFVKTIKGFEKGTNRSVFDDKTGNLIYSDGTPYKGGQLIPITESNFMLNQPKEDELAPLAEAFVHGRLDIKNIPTRTNARIAFMNEVLKSYPNADINKAQANARYLQDPYNLRTIGQVRAILPRLNELEKKAKQLDNTDIVAVNKLINWWKTETGKPNVVDFSSFKTSLIMEGTSAMTGGSAVTNERLAMELKNIQDAASPAQLLSVIPNFKRALQAREDASLNVPYSWEEVRGEKPPPTPSPASSGQSKTAEEFLRKNGGK